MKLRRLFSCAMLLTGFACSATMESSGGDDATDEPHVMPNEAYPEPPPHDAIEVNDASHRDEAICGLEVVVSEVRPGEFVVIEVPLPCDPTADVYMGCPPHDFEDLKSKMKQ